MAEITAKEIILKNRAGEYLIPYTIPYTAGDGISIDADGVISATGTTLGADLQSVFDLIYPVGSIYMSVNSVDPSALFGIGTWEQIKDMFLLAAGDNYKNEETGGEAAHVLSTSEMPSHTHTQKSCNSTGAHTHSRGTMDIKGSILAACHKSISGTGVFTTSLSTLTYGAGSTSFQYGQFAFTASKNWSGSTSSNGNHTHTTTLNNTGSGTAHNNMPPYLAVNVWKRTA